MDQRTIRNNDTVTCLERLRDRLTIIALARTNSQMWKAAVRETYSLADAPKASTGIADRERLDALVELCTVLGTPDTIYDRLTPGEAEQLKHVLNLPRQVLPPTPPL